jgi:hypothetical protein
MSPPRERDSDRQRWGGPPRRGFASPLIWDHDYIERDHDLEELTGIEKQKSQ